MGTRRKLTFAGLVSLALALCLTPPAPAQYSTQQQNPQTPFPSQGQQKNPAGALDDDPFKQQADARMEKGRETERHKMIVADTDRLVQLSNELKVEVDKTTKDEMSLSVIRKAAEIEKLSHDVKERMKN